MEEPVCARCIKAGINCAGYRRRPFIIVPAAQAKTGKRKTRARPPSQKPIQEANKACPSSYIEPEMSLSSCKNFNAPIRGQLISQFVDVYCPKDMDRKHYEKRRLSLVPQYWAHILPSFEYKLPSLQLASMALSCTYLGAVNGQQEFLRYGIQLYAQALRAVSKALYYPKVMEDAEMIYAIYLLAAVEVHDIPSSPSNGWHAHLEAAYNLLERRIDTLEDCGDDIRTIYSMIRKQHLYMGVVRRKTSPFCHPKWKSVVAKMNLTHYDEIVGIMLEFGGTFESVDNMNASSDYETKLQLLHVVNAKVREQISAFRKWFHNFQSNHGLPVTTVAKELFPDSKELLKTSFFEKVFVFDNFLFCQSLTHLWCGHFFLLQIAAWCNTIVTTTYSLPPSSFCFADYLSDELDLFKCLPDASVSNSWDKTDLLADMLAMSIPYHMMKGLGAIGPNSSICILYVVTEYFSMRAKLGNILYQDRREWCQRVLDDMQSQRVVVNSRKTINQYDADHHGYRQLSSVC